MAVVAMIHTITVIESVKNGRPFFYAACSCSRWIGRATETRPASMEDGADHLEEVRAAASRGGE